MPLPAWWLTAAFAPKASAEALGPALTVALAQAVPEPNTPSLWQTLKTESDIANQRPAQAAGVVASALNDRTGPYHVLKQSQTRTYLRLSPREYWLWQQLDGTRTVQDLVVAYFLAHGTFAYGLIVGLVQQLGRKSMLREPPQLVLTAVTQALTRRTPAYRLGGPARTLLTRQWAIGGLDHLLDRLYRGGAWLFFTWPAQIFYLVVSVAGLVLFVGILGDSRYQFGAGSLGASVVMLWVAAILPIVIHELGHALTTKHYGREVHRGGLMLYFGMPAAFMDTTDIWMEGKRARLAVTWAGPYTGFIIAGLCAIVLWRWPGLPAEPFLLQMAAVGAFTSVLNLNPLLKLDGYYLLSDALEIPRLRERSLAFIQHKLVGKLVQREHLNRDELVFVVFGALSAVWTVYVVYLSVIIWNARVVHSLVALRASPGDLGVLLVNGLLIVLAVSFLSLAGLRAYQAGGTLLAGARRAGLFDGAERLALALVIGLAVLVALAAWAGAWAVAALGLLALVVGTRLALTIARSLAGSGAAGCAWLLVAVALSLLVPAQLLRGLPLPGAVPAAVYLDLAALACAGLAALLGARLFVGLRGSWRAWSAGLLALGLLGLVVVLLAGALEQAMAALVHAVAGSLLLAGLWHWQALRLPPVTPLQALERPLTTAERLWDAFKLLAETLASHALLAYGRGAALRLEARFNQVSRARDWGIELKQGQVLGLPNGPAQASVDDFAELLAAALAALSDVLARTCGRPLARLALSHGYDALDWEQRETAEAYFLSQLPWAADVGGAGAPSAPAARESAVQALLARAPLFVAFTPAELQAVARRLRLAHFPRGAALIRQGEAGDRFYLLQRGRVEVVQQDAEGVERVLNELVSGDYFGETALLSGEPRNATIRALTPVEALWLSRPAFDQLLRASFAGRARVDTAARRLGLLRRIPLFREFESFELRLLAARLAAVELSEGQVVFHQGEVGDRFYIVEAGQVAVRVARPDGTSAELARRGPGEYFGEIALLTQAPRTATVVVTSAARLLALDAADFAELLRESRGFQRAVERAGSGYRLANEHILNQGG